jgi:hypothetical protein
VVPYLVLNIFFSDNSYIQSEIEADISAIISYDLDIFKASLLATGYFSTNSNIFFYWGTISKINPYK